MIRRQLDLFEQDYPYVLGEVRERLDAYNRADRDEAEELYGDYMDSVETGTEILAEVRDTYARNLEEGIDDRYEREFNEAARKRFPALGFRIENF